MALRTKTSRCVLGALVGAVALVSTPILWADAREDYKQGVAAVEAGRFADAAGLFRSALAERSEERHHLLPARRYYPHYYLGVALSGMKDCASALESFAESERQGKLRRSAELFADLEQRRRSCRQHQASVQTAFEDVEEILARGAEVVDNLDKLRGRPALASLWASGGFQTRQQEGTAALARARQLADSARQAGDLDALRDAESTAEGAVASLRTLVTEARKEMGDRNAATAEAIERLEARQEESRQALRSLRDLSPYPAGLDRRVKALEDLLKEADRRKEEAQATELNDLENRMEEARKSLVSSSRRPPRQLVEIVETFLRGDYLATLDLLVEADFRDRRAAGHACILETAAHFERYVTDGERDEGLLVVAKDTARFCAERNPPLSRKYLSPRFLSFYEQAITEPVEEPGEVLEETLDPASVSEASP